VPQSPYPNPHSPIHRSPTFPAQDQVLRHTEASTDDRDLAAVATSAAAPGATSAPAPPAPLQPTPAGDVPAGPDGGMTPGLVVPLGGTPALPGPGLRLSALRSASLLRASPVPSPGTVRRQARPLLGYTTVVVGDFAGVATVHSKQAACLVAQVCCSRTRMCVCVCGTAAA
jgi:hypothetical protein